MKAFRTLICTGLHTMKAYKILLGIRWWALTHPGCIHSEPIDWLVHRANVTLVKDCSLSLSVPEVILHEDFAIGEQIGLFKCKLLNWSAPPVVMADHPLKTCCMLFDSRNMLQDLGELIRIACSTADRCCLDKDSYDNDLVTLTGKDCFKRRELYALSTAFAGKAELLPDDMYAEIVGAKCLDPIAAAAVDDIEMQIKEIELPQPAEDSEENRKSRDRKVNELLKQLSSIMHNCAVRSRQNSRAA